MHTGPHVDVLLTVINIFLPTLSKSHQPYPVPLEFPRTRGMSIYWVLLFSPLHLGNGFLEAPNLNTTNVNSETVWFNLISHKHYKYGTFTKNKNYLGQVNYQTATRTVGYSNTKFKGNKKDGRK